MGSDLTLITRGMTESLGKVQAHAQMVTRVEGISEQASEEVHLWPSKKIE